MIILKSNREIEYIRAAGRITADALMLMRELAVPGVTTQELDRRCEEYIFAVRVLFPAVRDTTDSRRPFVPA